MTNNSVMETKIICKDCGELKEDGSGIGLCAACYAIYFMENEHMNNEHRINWNKDCPFCQEAGPQGLVIMFWDEKKQSFSSEIELRGPRDFFKLPNTKLSFGGWFSSGRRYWYVPRFGAYVMQRQPTKSY